MKQKCFVLFSILIICFLTACQSTPKTSSSDSGRVYISTDTAARRTSLSSNGTELRAGSTRRRSRFRGAIDWYRTLETEWPLLGRSNFVVPDERTTREDKGIVYSQGFENCGQCGV